MIKCPGLNRLITRHFDKFIDGHRRSTPVVTDVQFPRSGSSYGGPEPYNSWGPRGASIMPVSFLEWRCGLLESLSHGWTFLVLLAALRLPYQDHCCLGMIAHPATLPAMIPPSTAVDMLFFCGSLSVTGSEVLIVGSGLAGLSSPFCPWMYVSFRPLTSFVSLHG